MIPPIRRGGDTPDFGHAFSNCTCFRACGQLSLSSVQRARRLADEKRRKKERIPVKYKSADHLSGGLINLLTSKAADIVRSSYYIHGPTGDEINCCCFIMCRSTISLRPTRWYKTTVFYIYICSFFYLNPQPWFQYSDFENKWPLCEIILPLSILALLSSSACDSASAYKFLSELVDTGNGIVTSYRSSKMAATASQIYFRFPFWWRIAFIGSPVLFAYQISSTYLNPWLRYYYFRFLKTNGRHIEILLLPVSTLTVRFDMSKSLVVSTWGTKETPTSFDDIFIGTNNILMIFISAQNTKTDKLHASFL